MGGGIDVALRYGAGEWTDGETTLLFEEVVQPVGQPDLVARLQSEGVDLLSAPLIHVRSPQNRNWAGWTECFRSMGVPRADLRGVSFDNYVQAVQAAADGRGLMLGWRSITQRLVDDGTLVRWSDAEMRPGGRYYVTSARASDGRQANAAFVAWLLTVAASETPAPSRNPRHALRETDPVASGSHQARQPRDDAREHHAKPEAQHHEQNERGR